MSLVDPNARLRALTRVELAKVAYLLVVCLSAAAASCRPPISENSPLGARVSLTGAGASSYYVRRRHE